MSKAVSAVENGCESLQSKFGGTEDAMALQKYTHVKDKITKALKA